LTLATITPGVKTATPGQIVQKSNHFYGTVNKISIHISWTLKLAIARAGKSSGMGRGTFSIKIERIDIVELTSD
jgi:hypothetical protein